MADWLIFAEKHDQAQKIADTLFDKGKGKGKFNDGGFGGQSISSVLNGEVRIVHFSGHIYEMMMPPKQNDKYSLQSEEKTNRFGLKYGGHQKDTTEIFDNYPIELNLNTIKWKFSQDKFKSLSANMKQLYMNSQNIIVSTDFDNEGEMIFRNWQLNNIKQPKWNSMYRAKMNSTTPKDIKYAFQHLIPYTQDNGVLKSMYAQGFARSMADYEYGLSFTFYGWMLAQKNNTKRGQYGRLKNSLLGVIYQQELAHDNFKPSSNYRIDMVLPNGDILQGNEQLTFKTKDDAKQYLDGNHLSTQTSITYKETEKINIPPKLYSRNELLVALMKRHDNVLNKKDTWNTHLQNLYDQHSLLSYPRTDVQYISEEIYKTLQSLAKTKSVQQLLNKHIDSVISKHNIKNDLVFDINQPSKKKHVNASKLEGESHFALVPTDKEPTEYEKLSKAEQVVYFEDLSRTMSIFCNDNIVIQRQYQSNDNYFKATQNKTKQFGYKILLDNIKEDVGSFIDEGTYNVTYKISEVKAKRPSLFTKVSLISMMKRVNWGTSATRDSTIEDLINKGSIVIKDNHLRINPELKNTIQLLMDKGLINFEMTSEWQTQLNELNDYDQAIRFIETTRRDTYDVHKVFADILG
ncbi:DNA topoisomerase [Staphylococcus haemolyticus]|uniref:DNA topoisomerase n=1 Tax=Staphylococcus haemolyticus TaxID=1283 RepID=UPI00065FBB4F